MLQNLFPTKCCVWLNSDLIGLGIGGVPGCLCVTRRSLHRSSLILAVRILPVIMLDSLAKFRGSLICIGTRNTLLVSLMRFLTPELLLASMTLVVTSLLQFECCSLVRITLKILLQCPRMILVSTRCRSCCGGWLLMSEILTALLVCVRLVTVYVQWIPTLLVNGAGAWNVKVTLPAIRLLLMLSEVERWTVFRAKIVTLAALVLTLISVMLRLPLLRASIVRSDVSGRRTSVLIVRL